MKDIIKWCLNKKDGIRIVEPNENLSDAYIKEADETLDVMLSTGGKWKIIVDTIRKKLRFIKDDKK